MQRSGSADLPLHYGTVRLAGGKMAKLGLAITEHIGGVWATGIFEKNE